MDSADVLTMGSIRANTGAMSTENRRKWRRLEHALEVELRVIGSGESIRAIGSHLSPEGIFVQLSEPPPTNTKVRVSIGNTGSEGVQLEAEGVVVNQLAPSDSTDVVGVNIELKDTGASWRMIYELLASDS